MGTIEQVIRQAMNEAGFQSVPVSPQRVSYQNQRLVFRTPNGKFIRLLVKTGSKLTMDGEPYSAGW